MNKTYTAEQICEALKIDFSQVLNIYPYGSRVYGTDDRYSDNDYVIVYKSSLLPSGAFKDNAISSVDKKIQGTCYSRGGFIDAINNYQMSALECIFLPKFKLIQNKMNFELKKFDSKQFAKKVISLASASWHNADLAYKDKNMTYVYKNVYHALRILEFGIHIKETQKINYKRAISLKEMVEQTEDLKPKKFLTLFLELRDHLKNR